MPRIASVCLLALSLAVSAPAVGGADATVPVWLHRVTLDPVDPAGSVRRLAQLGFDIAGASPKDGTADVVGGLETLTALRGLGFAADRLQDLTPTEASERALSNYLSPSEVEQRLDQAVAAHPTLARKVQYATTGEGRPVWALAISDNVAVEEDEPAILFVAQHHAREVMTPEIAIDLVEWLLNGYGTDPDATRWVDTREIWVLPNHNPDGSNWVFTVDSSWRKNRRVNGNGTMGVDPNRNYPFKWGACSGSSGDGASDTYRGPSAASEPETFQGILELAREHRPVIALSYHTYSELVIFPYGCTGSYTPENRVFRDLASSMAVVLDSDDGQSWYQPGTAPELLYAVDGELTDWMYGELGTYGLTVEANVASQGFQPDYVTWRNSTVLRNRPGWRLLLDRVDGPSVRGHVRDACTGAPLEAGVSLDEVVFSNGEASRTSEPVHGRFQWLTLPGTFHLRVAEPGYTTQVHALEVGSAAADRDVELVPTGSRGLAVADTVVEDGGGDADGRADPGETVLLKVRLTNVGDAVTGVAATLSSSDPAVTILDGTALYGALAPGASADGEGFLVAVSATAADEAEVLLSLAVSADQPLCAPDAPQVTLRVTRGVPSCPALSEPLDVDPGWTIANTGTGGWQFGPPLGNGGSTGPAAAATGPNAYGTNLAGPYGANGDFVLTTTPFDLRGLRHAELRYQRWLDNEPGYDIATVEVSIDGGQSWLPLWSGFARGEGWQLDRRALPPEVDQEEDVRFRFRLRSDPGVQRAGFYVDDVQVCGESVPSAAGRLKQDEVTVNDGAPDGGNGNGAADVGETVTLSVRVRSNLDTPATGVRAFLSTTTAGVRVRTDWVAFPDVPPAGTSDSLAPHLTFSVDTAPCRTRIAFRLDVLWDGGQSTSTFTVPVGTPTTMVILNDGFEAGAGWSSGTTATAGSFVREEPWAVNDAQGTPVQPDVDTTPSPGELCWITANPRPNGNFNPLSGDVDRGTVWVQSPAFDGAAADRLGLTARRWFVRRNAGAFDSSRYRLLVSANGGGTWSVVEQVTADSPTWASVAFELRDVIVPTGDMRVRMEVTEQIDVPTGDTLVEGLLDDVRIERERLECAPFTPPPHSAPNGVGSSVRVARQGGDVRLDWTAPPTDPGHGPATGYRVYRSVLPGAGFAMVGQPTALFDVRRDEALGTGDAYFLVVAENVGGTSGDAPLP